MSAYSQDLPKRAKKPGGVQLYPLLAGRRERVMAQAQERRRPAGRHKCLVPAVERRSRSHH